MFGVSFPELAVIFLVVLLVYGPERLPEMARTLGKLASDFRRVSESVRREFYNTMYKPAEEEFDRLDRTLRSVKQDLLAGPDQGQETKGTSAGEPSRHPDDKTKGAE